MSIRETLEGLFSTAGQSAPGPPPALVEAAPYVSAGILRQQFVTRTNCSPDASFGAYALVAMGDALHVGVGNRPGRSDGALVLKARDTTLSPECALPEQGIHEIAVHHDALWIPGSDATGDWDFGNVYLCDKTGWHMRRTVANGVHCLGLWHNQTKLYLGAQLYGGGSVHTGHVLVSHDDGLTWPQSVRVTDYRVFDVVEHGSALYATGTAETDYSGMLYRSTDGGLTWRRMGGVRPLMPARMCLWNGSLIAIHQQQKSLYAIQAGGKSRKHKLQFTVPAHWNVLADGEDGYLYVLATDGVWRSGDLKDWQFFCSFNTAIAIAPWTSANSIVIADEGLDAGLWLAEMV